MLWAIRNGYTAFNWNIWLKTEIRLSLGLGSGSGLGVGLVLVLKKLGNCIEIITLPHQIASPISDIEFTPF